VGYAFIALPMAAFLGLFIYPMVYAFYISAHEWGALGKIASVGADNYRELFGSDFVPFFGDDDFVFEKAIRNTIRYTAVVVPSQMALGLFMAVIVNQALRGRAFFRAAFYFPSLTSSAAITAIAMYILASDGLLNVILNTNRAWFAESETALESIMALNIFTTSATLLLYFLAALQSIPTDV
jgi:multiple sugar transport system permease protein